VADSLSPDAQGDIAMKKTSDQTARRPLTLDRQTIRQLSSADLAHAAGGSDVSIPRPIPTHYESCTVYKQQ
jgi:hypothetical protein